jgi:hypothetical protein
VRRDSGKPVEKWLGDLKNEEGKKRQLYGFPLGSL